jgi:SAM-dependent methyltransferase
VSEARRHRAQGRSYGIPEAKELTGFKDHFSGHAASYAQARPLYPRALFEWLAREAPARDLAWDAGCGNGQAAVALARDFASVHATDPSATQIDAATPHPRVRYAVEPGESCTLIDHGVDLVTVAQALHWFDFERHFAEARRVLRPDGLYAAWSYGLMRIDPAIDPVLAHFEHEVVGPYWPPERRHVDAGYRDIPFPLAPLEVPAFAMHHDWRLPQVLGYLETWSAVQRYRAARGTDPMPALAAALTPAWGDPLQPRRVEWPLVVLAGRR